MNLTKFEQELNTLNENQLKAVKHLGGPLFVVAGAGTGKTKTLTTRISYLVNELNVDPNRILGVTFTNKAAKEIRQRVNDIIYPSQMGGWLYTFHAFGLRILREFASELKLGYDANFTVIDEDDGLSIVRDIIKKRNIDSKQYTPRLFKTVISNHKTQIESITDPIFETVYLDYTKYLIKEQLMDFDDLIVYTYKLLKYNLPIRVQIQNRFDHVLIDEFQDTDKIQYSIIKLIDNPNTVVVGDPDQSIYAFRGARYENNQLFLKDFNAKQIVLDKNYRSTNNILKAANSLIKHNNSSTTSKELVSDYGAGEQVSVVASPDDFSEVRYVTDEISKLINVGYKYEDIAILYRNNHLSRSFEHSFQQNRIPYIIYGGLSYYDRKEVKDILAYFQLLVNLDSDFYLRRIINVPARKIGNVTFSKLEEHALNYNMTILDSIGKVSFSAGTANNLMNFKDMIYNLRKELVHTTDLVSMVDLVFNETGYAQMLKDDKDERSEERKENILELKSIFRQALWNYEGTNLEIIKQLLDEIALYTDRDKTNVDNNVVKLATVHQVKGLEFKVVFVVAMETGIFPNDRVYGNNFELEEERRVFYVAITRAKEKLYISYCNRRMLYGRITPSGPSMFVNEIRIKEPQKFHERLPDKVKEQVNNLVFKESDLVTHEVFGDGVVVEIKGDIITIAFNYEHGIKKLLKTHPSIKKKEM